MPVAVTNYKGVLDDTFLGQAYGGTISNEAYTYPSGVYREPPPVYDDGQLIATTICGAVEFSSVSHFNGP